MPAAPARSTTPPVTRWPSSLPTSSKVPPKGACRRRRILVASLPGGLPGGLSACATAVGDKAALVVVFDGRTTTLERVRLKIRRARELLGKSLPAVAVAEKPSSH